MTSVPSIKATAFQTISNEVTRLLDSGALSDAELEDRLLDEDLVYVRKQLAASSWVPVDTHARLLGILVDFGRRGSRDEILRAEGERAAVELHRLDMYRQFEASHDEFGSQVGSVMVSLAAVIYNFARWSHVPGLGNTPHRIVVEEAWELPEIVRIATEGFIAYMFRAALKRTDLRVTSERPTRDRIVFSIRAPDAARGGH